MNVLQKNFCRIIAVPLIVQTFFIFFFGYLWAKMWKVSHDIAAPAAMIGASNFFELSVAVAISLFGLSSGATLATVVGVLVEVPVMLILVKIANSIHQWFIHKEPVPLAVWKFLKIVGPKYKYYFFSGKGGEAFKEYTPRCHTWYYRWLLYPDYQRFTCW